MTLVAGYPARAEKATLWFCVGALALCLVLGGGTRAFHLSDAIAEALCLPLLIVAIPPLFGAPLPASLRAALIIFALMLALPLLQLIPLPPAIWTKLNGREAVVEGYRLAQMELPWLGLSLTPENTRQSLLTLLPPFSVFLFTTQLGKRQRALALNVFIGFVCLSIALGLLQVLTGASSPFRFYNWDDRSMVGFFANRNHFASMLSLTALIVTTAIICRFVDSTGTQSSPGQIGRSLAHTSALLCVLGLVMVSVILAQSRAGLGLSLIAILASFAVTIPFADWRKARYPLIAIGVVALLAFLVGADQAIFGLWKRITADASDIARSDISSLSKIALAQYFPFGSGTGSFVTVYAALDTTATAVSARVNRVHNDFIEWALEGGVASLLILGLAVGWLIWMNIRAWMPNKALTLTQSSTARAVAFAPFLLLLHSAFDYPLRTIAMMGILAFLAGLCIEPLRDDPEEKSSRSSHAQPKRRRSSSRSSNQPRPVSEEW